ncbi:hypothetical protein [Sagittula stellata]|uniref:Uncharacterized protein n=1 Tax=Sagittula stellata (strain ATCC 700073 / DSM 11524 / E-37) TaxID=388399 RepID=A3JYV4_SAGS3|nr:hypothetical protein [Sagittula stellata]EBA09657.1 hypothetical protein SSE37_07613 [Sagittula stellata E-37]
MFIAVNGMSETLPDDVRDHTLFLQKAAGPDRDELPGGDLGGPQIASLTAAPAKAEILDRWDVQAHQYTTEAEVEASILARLLTSKGSLSRYGLVQEAKRFCIQKTGTGRQVEYGTAVRLSVAVLSADFDLAVTLPNIAAKAQISNLQARISISVDGFVGPLGLMLPAPDNLDVENLGIYTAAFKAIQGHVFGPEGERHIAPTLLGYQEATSGGRPGK